MNKRFGAASLIYTPELPYGYTPVNYIEADGRQYFDMGFSPEATTRIDFKVETTSNTVFDGSPFFGARMGTSSTARFFPIAYQAPPNDNNCRTTFGASTHNIPISGNTILEGSFQPSNNISIINGVEYDLSNANFLKTNNNHLYMFATSGYDSIEQYMACGRTYYCIALDEINNIHYAFKPCVNSNGIPGCYELIHNQFHSSESGVDFLFG